MNHCVPEWNFEGDLHVTNQKKSTGPDHDLVELLWQNGQVVLNNQTYRKQDQPRRAVRQDQADPMGIGSYGNSSHLIQGDEPVSWIHNPFDDSFEKEFCSSLFNDLPSSDPAREVPFLAFQQKNPMHPPRSQLPGLAKRSGNLEGLGSPVSPGKTVEGSSHCGSNQVRNDDLRRTIILSKRGQTETFEPTFASSSDGSDSSFEKTCRRKRKATYEESESPTEATELESAGGNRSSRRLGSAKRSRAAEVHNLSERRRRDRINEKMKALQELIPHCDKSDKASMLDEAIEYLKSLQLQLQVMWMGGGIGPMMFPGVHPYLSRMSMGMAPVMNPVSYPNQMQNHALTEQYARYLAFHQMQTNTQNMNMNMNMNMSMMRFNPQAMQQIHPMGLSGGSVGSFGRGATTNDALT